MMRSKIFFSQSIFNNLFKENHIPTKLLNKLHIAINMGVQALNDPSKGNAVAALADVSSKVALRRMYEQMRNDPVGRDILKDKPLLDIKNIEIENLLKLPRDTLGNCFGNFLKHNENHLSDREPPHFVDDLELSYVMLRYRQLHDISHLVYGIGISVESEVLLKCIELIQTRIPMTFLASLLGPLACPLIKINKSAPSNSDFFQSKDNNSFDQFNKPNQKLTKYSYSTEILLQQLIPWAISTAAKVKKPMHLVYVEKWMTKPMHLLREHCGIELPPEEFREYLT